MTTLIGSATSLFGWTRPTPGQLLLLVGCGFFGGMAQILVTLSLRFTDASLLAPFDYTTGLVDGDWLPVLKQPARFVNADRRRDRGAGGDLHPVVRPAARRAHIARASS